MAVTSSSVDLLKDTLTLVRLARETAIAHGKTSQGERFTPFAEDLKKVVDSLLEPAAPTPPPGAMVQNDFRAILSALSNQRQKNPGGVVVPSANERNQIVVAMAAGGMTEIDIARQMGMTIEEVRTLLQVDSKKNIFLIGGSQT